jgi:hypothetical protein
MPVDELSRKKRKALGKKQERWDQIAESLQDYREWQLDYDIMESYPETPIKDDLGFYILAEFPKEEDNNLIQLPYGLEWAYFESLVSTELGEDNWIPTVALGGWITSPQTRSESPNFHDGEGQRDQESSKSGV